MNQIQIRLKLMFRFETLKILKFKILNVFEIEYRKKIRYYLDSCCLSGC